MKQLAVIVLSVMMLSAAFVGIVSAQPDSRTANLTAVSPPQTGLPTSSWKPSLWLEIRDLEGGHQ